MKIDFKKNLVWLIIGALLIVFYKMLDKIDVLFSFFGKVANLLSPFVWGFVIAYFLIIIMKNLENKFKLNRKISLILTYLIFFVSIFVIIRIMAPVIIDNIVDLINNLPGRVVYIQQLVEDLIGDGQILRDLNIDKYFNNNIGDYMNFLVDFLNKTLNSVLLGVINFTSGVLNFVIGVIVSIYILLDVDSFVEKIGKFSNAFLGEERSKTLKEFIHLCDNVFRNFFVGKAIDSMIIGVLCYFGLFLLGAPYAMLSSLIVGVFNMIPYIGPIIGAVPAVILTLFVDPIKALWVAVFILILQQVDGNIIGPKILGDKVGIAPFSILLAITIGGGFFGIMGMLVAVPIYKIISVVVEGYVDKKIEKNKFEQESI